MALYVVKPAGRYRLNTAHALARGLSFACPMDNPSAPVDLVSGTVGVVNSGIDTAHISPFGKAALFPGSNTTGAIRFAGLRPIPANGVCTIMVLANPVSEATSGALISQRNSGGNRQVTLYTNTGTGFGTTAGVFSLRQVTANSTYNNSAGPSSAITGQWEWYGASSEGTADGTNTRYYVGASLKATVANVFTSGSIAIDEDLWLGAPANYSGNPQYAHNRGIAAAFVWNRVLSQTEISQFISNPWAFVEEDDEQQPPAAVGAALLSTSIFEFGVGAAVLTIPQPVEFTSLATFELIAIASFASANSAWTSTAHFDLSPRGNLLAPVGLRSTAHFDFKAISTLSAPAVPGAALSSVATFELFSSAQLIAPVNLSSTASFEFSSIPTLGSLAEFTFLTSSADFSFQAVPVLQFQLNVWQTASGSSGDWTEIAITNNSTEDSTVH